MRFLFAPLMLVLVAALSSISIGALAAIRGLSPQTANPDHFQIVASIPPAFQLDPEGLQLRALISRKDGSTFSQDYDLDRLALGSSNLKGIKASDGRKLYLYQFEPAEKLRFGALQRAVQVWRDKTEERDEHSFELSVRGSGCFLAESLPEERLSNFWLSIDDGENFSPLERNMDLSAQFDDELSSDQIQAC